VDDQTEYSDEAPAVKRPRADRTYVARLDFMTQMHLLRLDGAIPSGRNASASGPCPSPCWRRSRRH